MSSPLPPKKDVALALLERSSVFVYLDPRRDGVVTPVGFKKDPKLVLQVGMNMAVPILDLKFDEQGMSCTLSFNRTPFFCIVPWSAIFALTDDAGQGIVWPDDVPRELMEAQAQAQRRAALRVVPKDEVAPAPPALETKAKSAKKTNKSDKPHWTEVVDGEAPAPAKRRSAKTAADTNAVNMGPKAKKASTATAAKVEKAPGKADAKKVGAEDLMDAKEAKSAKKASASAKDTATASAKGAPKKPSAKKATGTRAEPGKSSGAPKDTSKADRSQPSLFDAAPPSKPAPAPPPLPASATSPAPPASPAPPSSGSPGLPSQAQPSPGSPPPQRFGKAKRELPPYLRVVK